MSRLIKKPIEIPNGVEVKVEPKNVVVKGPLGQFSMDYTFVKFRIDGNKIWVEKNDDVHLPPRLMKKSRAFWGTRWSLLQNMIIGVSQGFKKELEVQGVGYRAQLQGKSLVLTLGYSHPIKIDPPEGITIEVPRPSSIVVKGASKELVGQVAANIRKARKPMVFARGKGVRYLGEHVITKEVKKA